MKDYHSVCLNITEDCNLKCSWCYQQEHRSSRRFSLCHLSFLRDIMQSLNVSSITFIGGEPTTHPDFISILGFFADCNVALITNGLAFSNPIFLENCMRSGLNKVALSIKGVNSESFMRCTGSNCFGQFLSSVYNLRKSNIPTSYNFVYSGDYDDVEIAKALLQFCRDFSLPFVLVSDVRPYFQSGSIRSFANLSSKFEHFCQDLLEGGIEIVVRPNNPLCYYSTSFISEMMQQGRLQIQCSVRQGGRLHFNTNLDIILCNEISNVCLGKMNLDYTTPKEFLLYLSNLRNDTNLSKLSTCCPSLKCVYCDLWSQCGGSCLLHWIR